MSELEKEPCENWQNRESIRFAKELYKHVPWQWAGFWINTMPDKDHFAHVSIQDPSKLAYTPDDRHGREDRQIIIKPGKYLRKFFPELTDQDIEFHVIEWSNKFSPCEVKFTKNGIESAKVYISGPTSCMDGSHFDLVGEHPCRVYDPSNGADLSIAYIGTLEYPTARSVVWMDQKYHSVIYGDRRLKYGLEKLGYIETSYFNDAKIVKIENKYNQIICPYLDMAEYANVNGKFLVLNQDEGCSVKEITGCLGEEEEYETCCGCHGRIDTERDSYFNQDDGVYCESCYNESFSYCEYCEETVSNDNIQHVESVDQYVCDHCLDNNFAQCDDTTDYYPMDRLTELSDGRLVCESALEDYCYCEETQEFHPYDQMVGLENGDLVHISVAFKCEDCQQYFLIGDLKNDHCEDCEKQKHLEYA